MRLLQVSLRSLLLYSLVLVLISIPVSHFSIQAILNEEVDESISAQADQFLRHIKSFEYLDDLETDLGVLDQLSYNIHIKPYHDRPVVKEYQTILEYDSIERDERPFRQLSSSVDVKGKSYLLTVRMSLVDNNDLVMTIGVVQIVLSVFLVIGLLLLNRTLSKRLWRPFYKMLEHLKAYELDKNELVPLEKSNIIEFNDLNKAISHLIERNRKIFLQQKEFLEDASHELQTPIAIFQSKLDKLMQSPSLSQSDAETLQELEVTAQRMARLNKNLLLLSKIDNDQFMNTEIVDLERIIELQLSFLRPMAELEGITIRASIERKQLKANRTLIEILITNLLHNAIRYSPKNQEINISIKGNSLIVDNKGNPLKMEPEKMMVRFKKESSDPNSVGLGLSIIKKICDRYAYTITYKYENGSHFFTITF